LHYRRYTRGNGDATRVYTGHMPLADRLATRIARGGPDECWPWTGTRNPKGYGLIRLDGQMRGAHRAVFFVTHGRWPEVCRHTCDNPPCCNPAHLLDGSTGDNLRDAYERGQKSPTRGTAQRGAKLSEEQVREIRSRYATGTTTQRALASEFGVSHILVGFIVRREAWGWLED
jgi:hypothetical protein